MKTARFVRNARGIGAVALSKLNSPPLSGGFAGFDFDHRQAGSVAASSSASEQNSYTYDALGEVLTKTDQLAPAFPFLEPVMNFPSAFSRHVRA
jgi:hypothetical protein